MATRTLFAQARIRALSGNSILPNNFKTSLSQGTMSIALNKLPMYVSRSVSRMVNESPKNSEFQKVFLDAFEKLKDETIYEIGKPCFAFAFHYEPSTKTLSFRGIVMEKTDSDVIRISNLGLTLETDHPQSWCLGSVIGSNGNVLFENGQYSDESMVIESISTLLSYMLTQESYKILDIALNSMKEL